MAFDPNLGTNVALNILILCDLPNWGGGASTIRDHIVSFKQFSDHNIFIFSNIGEAPPSLRLEKFDVLVIHYSLFALWDSYIGPELKRKIRDFNGLKVQFVQDEYRRVDALNRLIRDFGVHILYTCIPSSEIEKVYPASQLPGVRRINTLTGYVPEGLTRLSVPLIQDRRIDVGYRARKLPFWLGELGVEKWQIVDKFLAASLNTSLKCDLSYKEESRIYGKEWIEFLKNCRCTLGVESGSSFIDRTGELQESVESFQAANPLASYEVVHERFLRHHNGRVAMNQISPRCFEAAALRTVMVLYEGSYSGILKPWTHYIPLRKDFGNFEEVAAAIGNPVLLQKIADQAYSDIALNPEYSYRGFVARFDRIISEEFLTRSLTSSRSSMAFGFARILLFHRTTLRFKSFVGMAKWLIRGVQCKLRLLRSTNP